MKRLVFIISLLFSLCACERYEEVEVEAPYKPKVVVACFLRGESSTLEVAVTRSLPVFGVEPIPGVEPEPEYIKDAIVQIKQGANHYLLPYDTSDQLYRLDIPGEMNPGEEYELSVSSGSTVTTGKTIIPGKVNTGLTLKFDSLRQSDGTYQYRASLTCKMLDAGYHYIQFYPVIVYSDSSRDLLYANGMMYSAAELSEGQSALKTFLSASAPVGVFPQYIELNIVNGDPGYAKNNTRVFDLSGSGISPFIEPAITYSNMSDGIGIIGSYNPETKYYLPLR